MAYYFKVKRWYLYAILSLLSFIIAGGLRPYPMPNMFYTFIGPGAIIILAGIVILVRFLRNNPKMELEELSQASEAKI